MDKPKSQKDENKPDEHTLPSVTEYNADISCAHSDSTYGKREPSHKQGMLDRIKKTTSTDKITAFATFIIMIATTAYSVIALKQWKVMERQTEAAFQQLSTAKGSIKIANDALDDSRKSGDEQSRRAERLTKANENLSNAASQSLNATIEHSRLDQRAWVGIDELVWDEYKEGDKVVCIKEGTPFKVGVHIKNTGKTPARLSATRSYIYHVERGEKPVLQENAILSITPTGATLFPGGRLNIGVTKPVIYTKEQIDLLKSGQYTVYIIGMIVYKDVFGKTHSTKFCDELSSDLARFEKCIFHNEAN